MKNWYVFIILIFFSSNAFAKNWIMERFDLDDSNTIIKREMVLAGCIVKKGSFEYADKNNDGELSGREARDAVNYLFNKRRCPKQQVRG